MTLRAGHGTGAGEPRIEVLPPDELPDPVAAEADPVARRQNGTLADSAAAKRLGARGGAAKAAKARLVSALGLSELASDADFRPYRDAGDAWVREHLMSLAKQAGGETVGPGPSSIVATAGVQLAASRFFSDKAMATGDVALFQTASALGNAHRQNVLAAYELAVREAKASKQHKADDDDFTVPGEVSQ